MYMYLPYCWYRFRPFNVKFSANICTNVVKHRPPMTVSFFSFLYTYTQTYSIIIYIRVYTCVCVYTDATAASLLLSFIPVTKYKNETTHVSDNNVYVRINICIH